VDGFSYSSLSITTSTKPAATQPPSPSCSVFWSLAFAGCTISVCVSFLGCSSGSGSDEAAGCCARLAAMAHCTGTSTSSASPLLTTSWSSGSIVAADPAYGAAGAEVLRDICSVLDCCCWVSSACPRPVVPPQRNRGSRNPWPSNRREMLQGLEQRHPLPSQPQPQQPENRTAAEKNMQSGQQRLIMKTGSRTRRPRQRRMQHPALAPPPSRRAVASLRGCC